MAAVIAQPDNDLPRLLSADWWEEQGDTERGELVRVQLELAELRNRFDARGFRIGHRNKRVRDLMSRETALLDAHAGLWIEETGHRLAFHGYAEVEFRRGFIEVIVIGATDWDCAHESLRRVTPIREVEFLRPPLTWSGRSTAPYWPGQGRDIKFSIRANPNRPNPRRRPVQQRHLQYAEAIA